MKDFYKELFDYTFQSNSEFLKLFGDERKPLTEYSVKLLNHIVNAHQIWNSRMLGIDQGIGVWDLRNPGTIISVNENNYNATLRILNGDLDKTLTYTNTKGLTYTNTFKDVLFHVVNHSTYHRAQVAADLKRNGVTPPVTDYIAYKR